MMDMKRTTKSSQSQTTNNAQTCLQLASYLCNAMGNHNQIKKITRSIISVNGDNVKKPATACGENIKTR